MDWALQKPTTFSVVGLSNEQSLALVERDIQGQAGIAVVGIMKDNGDVTPDYCFPYVRSTHISSDARISYERKASVEGFSGMCEDSRLGMAMIFDVQNITDVMRDAKSRTLEDPPFTRVALTLLLQDGMVILPISENNPTFVRNRTTLQERFATADVQNDPEALERMAKEELARYEKAMKRVEETDVFSVVDNFFMPHGMESDNYYFLGTILSRKLFVNELTDERFYRILLEVNGIELMVAVNEKDLVGAPEPGMRLKGHGMLMGELLK